MKWACPWAVFPVKGGVSLGSLSHEVGVCLGSVSSEGRCVLGQSFSSEGRWVFGAYYLQPHPKSRQYYTALCPRLLFSFILFGE